MKLCVHTVALAVVGAMGWSTHPALARDKDSVQAAKDLAQAEKGADPSAYLEALKGVLEGNDSKSVRTAVVSYSRFASTVLKKYGSRDFMTLHGKAAAAFAPIQSKDAVEEYLKLLGSHADWQGRLLLLDAAGIAKPVSRLDAALKALEDEHPVVVRRALQYLAMVRQVPVTDTIIKRYMDVSKKKPKQGDAADWDRARLAFQSALQRQLHVDLPVAEDYKNYFDARKSNPNVFEAPTEQRDAVSRVTLFGAAVTGKNIVFVVDTSGSMMSTDPRPPGEKAREREGGRTVVGDPSKQKDGKPQGPPEDRQRMFRARRELGNVVRSLPSDVHFNIVDYSSDVRAWKQGMVPASDANKKTALKYIEGLKADGITVTDMALEEAFADLNIDTIYLITDGAPTHIGSTGGGLPEDALQIIAAIHQRVEELNFLRGVRIFTLGFREAHEEFLKKLAADNGGKYVAIQ